MELLYNIRSNKLRKLYIGYRDKTGVAITVNDEKLQLEPSLELHSHSPTGFEWGSGGSGPSQLALAVLLDLYSKDTALKYYMKFKFEFIASAAQDGFVISSDDIDRWLIKQKSEEN